MTATLTITAQGEHAVEVLEHVINPALKDYGCTVEWPGYPASRQITVHVDGEELAEMTGHADERP